VLDSHGLDNGGTVVGDHDFLIPSDDLHIGTKRKKKKKKKYTRGQSKFFDERRKKRGKKKSPSCPCHGGPDWYEQHQPELKKNRETRRKKNWKNRSVFFIIKSLEE